MSFMDQTGYEEAKNAAELDDKLREMGLSAEGVMENPDDLFALLEKGTINPSQMNDLAMRMGDIGNEQLMGIVLDRLRTTGGTGGLLQGFGQMVNQAYAARSGSLTVDIGGRVSNTVDSTDPEPRDFVAELQVRIDAALDANGMNASDVPEKQDVVSEILGIESSDSSEQNEAPEADVNEAIADATLAAVPAAAPRQLGGATFKIK